MAHEIEDPLVEKAEVLLTKSEKGFEKWLKSQSDEQLEQIIDKLGLRKGDMQEYLDFIRITETVGVCSKCEWKTGCVACHYRHAVQYVIRHHHCPEFWYKREGKAFKKAAKKTKLKKSSTGERTKK